ncbi:MBL fold metallo-hydrolase [Isosphaeraceae bacterium EP7]
MRFRPRLLAWALLLLSVTRLPAQAGELEIYFIDVMGGAATLVVTPERESILIDSGWPGLGDRDPKRIVHVLKDVLKLDHIDHLVTTHWHMDHFGGVEGLSRLTRIDHFWDRGLPNLAAADQDKALFPDGPKADDALGIAYLKASKGKRTTLKAGDRLPLKGKVNALVLAASGAVIEGSDFPVNPLCANAPADLPPDPSDNAQSITLRFRLGAFDFLDCGDLTWRAEKRLVCPLDRIGPIDLYQVTHHGMDISNHPTLLQTVRPKVAIMNNGPRKGGSAETVARLRGIDSIEAAYQLHKNEETAASENVEASRIANADSAGGKYIKVSVSEDGSKFGVQINGEGEVRTFKVD